MDYYKKYYSVFEEIEPKIISASEQSKSQPLWYLWGDIETVISMVEKCQIECNDEVGNFFSASKNSLLQSMTSTLNKIKAYDIIDSTYCKLFDSINELKNKATQLQDFSLKKPKTTNQKYKYYYYTFDNNTQSHVKNEGFDKVRYSKDLAEWQKQMKNYETLCKVASLNINKLLDFLKNANIANLAGDKVFSSPTLIDINSINSDLNLTYDEILLRVEYQVPLNTDVCLEIKTEYINGFPLKYACVYDNTIENDEQRNKFEIFVQDSIDRISGSGLNVEVLDAISEYNIVFDESYLCDACSVNSGYFPVGGYFDGKNIKAHFFIDRFYKDNLGNIINESDYKDTTTAILHEIGHGFDNVTKENVLNYNYAKIISDAENAGTPLYVRPSDIHNPDGSITSRNNYYKNIYYDSDGLAYVLDDNGIKIDIFEFDDVINMNGDTYVVASAQEAAGHCGEVAAEIFRYSNIDPNLIEERALMDDSYELVGSSLGNRMKNYGESVLWLDKIM